MRALFVAFMLCVASASVVEPASVLGDDPMQFDQLLDSAFLRHDVAFLQAATADDMRFTHAVARGGAVWNKQQFVDAARVDDGLARTVDSIQVEYGDIVETLGHLQVRTPRPDRAEYHVYFVRLYRRGPAGWQFVSHRTVREVDGPLSTAPARAPDMPLNPAVGTEEGPVHPGNGVSYPRVVHEVSPPYTADAMRAKIHGKVVLECVVNTDGSVGDVKVVQSLDAEHGLNEEAIKAAKQWRFVPGSRDGQPVPVLITIEMAFAMGKHQWRVPTEKGPPTITAETAETAELFLFLLNSLRVLRTPRSNVVILSTDSTKTHH